VVKLKAASLRVGVVVYSPEGLWDDGSVWSPKLICRKPRAGVALELRSLGVCLASVWGQLTLPYRSVGELASKAREAAELAASAVLEEARCLGCSRSGLLCVSHFTGGCSSSVAYRLTAPWARLRVKGFRCRLGMGLGYVSRSGITVCTPLVGGVVGRKLRRRVRRALRHVAELAGCVEALTKVSRLPSRLGRLSRLLDAVLCELNPRYVRLKAPPLLSEAYGAFASARGVYSAYRAAVSIVVSRLSLWHAPVLEASVRRALEQGVRASYALRLFEEAKGVELSELDAIVEKLGELEHKILMWLAVKHVDDAGEAKGRFTGVLSNHVSRRGVEWVLESISSRKPRIGLTAPELTELLSLGDRKLLYRSKGPLAKLQSKGLIKAVKARKLRGGSYVAAYTLNLRHVVCRQLASKAASAAMEELKLDLLW